MCKDVLYRQLLLNGKPEQVSTLGLIVIPVVGYITGVTDHFDIAESAAQTVLSSPSVTPILAIAVRPGMALIAVQRGDVAAASEQYTALASLQGILYPPSQGEVH